MLGVPQSATSLAIAQTCQLAGVHPTGMILRCWIGIMNIWRKSYAEKKVLIHSAVPGIIWLVQIHFY